MGLEPHRRRGVHAGGDEAPGPDIGERTNDGPWVDEGRRLVPERPVARRRRPGPTDRRWRRRRWHRLACRRAARRVVGGPHPPRFGRRRVQRPRCRTRRDVERFPSHAAGTGDPQNLDSDGARRARVVLVMVPSPAGVTSGHSLRSGVPVPPDPRHGASTRSGSDWSRSPPSGSACSPVEGWEALARDPPSRRPGGGDRVQPGPGRPSGLGVTVGAVLARRHGWWR